MKQNDILVELGNEKFAKSVQTHLSKMRAYIEKKHLHSHLRQNRRLYHHIEILQL